MKASRSSEILISPEETMDEFMGGRLRVIQSKSGYRFSIDAILLAEFVAARVGDVVVDLGTGCGIIPLVLLLNQPNCRAIGLEIQPRLAGQALRNALLNGFSHRMGVILGDIRHPSIRADSADVVVCNPPYREAATGRINPDFQRAIARHEVLASLDDILGACRRILKPGGRFGVIYTAGRIVDLLARMRGYELEPKRIQFIHPGPESEAKRILVEAFLRGRRGLHVLPPLMDQGKYSIWT